MNKEERIGKILMRSMIAGVLGEVFGAFLGVKLGEVFALEEVWKNLAILLGLLIGATLGSGGFAYISMRKLDRKTKSKTSDSNKVPDGANKRRSILKGRTVEENTERYVQLMKLTDVLLVSIDKFYWDCRGEEEYGADLVIWELEKKGFEVKTVQIRTFLKISDYIQISKVF